MTAAPCPVCEVVVDVVDALDAGECPECGAPRKELYDRATANVADAGP